MEKFIVFFSLAVMNWWFNVSWIFGVTFVSRLEIDSISTSKQTKDVLAKQTFHFNQPIRLSKINTHEIGLQRTKNKG